MENRVLIILLAFLIGIPLVLGSFTNSADTPNETFRNGYGWSGHIAKDNAQKWAQEVEAKLEGETAILSKRTVEANSSSTDALTAAQSGSMITYSVQCTVTLPTAAAGLWYILVDANSTAGVDLIIDPGAGDSINGATNGNYIKNEVDAIGEGITIFSTGAGVWSTSGYSVAWTAQ